MKTAFNIKIEYAGEEVTLTILKGKKEYKVIYFGGIMGGVHKIGNRWKVIRSEDLEAGDLPQYQSDDKGGRLEIELNENTAQSIGKAIEHYLSVVLNGA